MWYKKTTYNDTPWVREHLKGRNDEQKAVIRYFCNEPACLSKKPISDSEYEEIIRKHLQSTDFKQKAFNKIGLDEDQVKEIEPVHFEGYFFNKNCFAKQGNDGLYRSSAYQISWLFFSDTQVYLYQNTFFLDADDRTEATEEYFYRDITNFSASSDTIEVQLYDKKTGEKCGHLNVNSNRFAVTVPGDKFYCSLEQSDYTERAIQGMKAKLREKKNA